MSTWDMNLSLWLEGRTNLQLPPACIQQLERLGVTTLGELKGLLSPQPPRPKNRGEVGRRCLSPTWAASRQPTQGATAQRLRLLSRTLKVPLSTVQRLASTVDQSLPRLFADARSAHAEWYLGMAQAPRTRTRSWREVTVRTLPGFAPPALQSKPFFLPGLSRLGPVWDQAERGTCVAQACGALLAYLSRGFTPSTQFLYHQAKLIDGLSTQEGTYLEAALKACADPSISGHHPLHGSDVGIPPSDAWPYEKHSIPGNPGQTPPPRHRLSGIYSGKRVHGTEPKVLCCSDSKRHLVDEIRWLLSEGLPVMGGFPLYESFQNPNSRRTGKITLPLLPGEGLVGYHAMTIIGFDDSKKVFIVRNSWGTGWAWECPYASDGLHLAGHAIIPYRYFSHPDIAPIQAMAIPGVEEGNFEIPLEARLYHQRPTPRIAGRVAAASGRPEPRRRRWWDFLRVG